MAGDDLASALEVFDDSRGRLFGIAYRMLGSVADAEDIVQEAWVRWQRTDRSVVRNPPGFLTTVTTRLAINATDSARSRRELYVGPWLPEPVDTAEDPSLGAERAEALEAAVLVLMEALPARERAAYVLREAFDYPYAQIAEILQTSEMNARQLVSRAKRHVTSNRREPVSSVEYRRVLDAFVDAARTGDLPALEKILAADVVSTSDGAGISRRAARVPIIGRQRVARFLMAFQTSFWPGLNVTMLHTNGQPSVLLTRGSAPEALLSLDISADGVDRLMWVMVPKKLAHVTLRD